MRKLTSAGHSITGPRAIARPTRVLARSAGDAFCAARAGIAAGGASAFVERVPVAIEDIAKYFGLGRGADELIGGVLGGAILMR